MKKIHLDDVQDNLKDCYLILEKSLVKELLLSFNGQLDSNNRKLANFLGLKFNEKWNKCPTIQNWYYNGILPLRIVDKLLFTSKIKWIDVEKNLIGIKLKKGSAIAKIKFPIKLDRSLGRIIGHILGDGSIDKTYLQPFFTNQDKTLLKEFEASVLTVCDLKPRIWIQKPGNFKENKSKWIKRVNSIEEISSEMQGALFYPKILGKLLYSIFGPFANGTRKIVPKISFEISREFRSGLLQAFYDDEGSVYVDSSGIRLFQNNQKILKDIKKLLSKFDIDSRKIKKYKRKNKNHFYFDISDIKNLKKFQKYVGFSSNYKSKSLEKLITNTEIGLKTKIDKGLIESRLLFLLNGKNFEINKIIEILKKSEPNIIWRRRSISRSLNQLNKEGKVVRNEIKVNKVSWSLSENLGNKIR